MVMDPLESHIAARERILATSYALFLRRGTTAVGINELVREAGVARATLYYHFPSKESLVSAFLERRYQVFVAGYLEAGVLRRADTAEGQLLAVFYVLDEWFRWADFESSSYLRVLLELGSGHRLGRESLRQLEKIRVRIQVLAAEADLDDPEGFSRACGCCCARAR
jgi:AcrR family transcriptional regulator